MKKMKRIGLVAHDHRKKDLIEWVKWNVDTLKGHQLYSTGTTGRLVEAAIKEELTEDEAATFSVNKLKSGPLGGDQQLGALICEGQIDMLIFLWDPMQPQPHEVDIKALLRISVLYNVPTACNRSTADYMISSPLMDKDYTPILKDYSAYIGRAVPE